MADLKEFNKNVVITPGNAGTLDMLNRGEIAMGPVWVDMFYTWKADGKLPPNMRLKLVSPGMPGQPMYYAVPAKTGQEKLAAEFIALATSPEVQAEGIVKQFNWYPGIDAKNLEGKLDKAAWDKLFADITPEDLCDERQAVPDRALLQRHPRNLREEGRELIASLTPTFSRAVRIRRDRPFSAAPAGSDHHMTRPSSFGLILIAPALAMIAALFLYPLGFSLTSAFTGPDGGLSLDAFREGVRSLFDRHPLHALHRDRLDAPDGAVLHRHRRDADPRRNALAGRVAALPLSLAALHSVHRRGSMHAHIPGQERPDEQFPREPGRSSNRLQATSLLDWRGIIITFVWKQVPFVTLMLAGAMASLDRATIEAGRNLGASRLRVLIELVLPQVAQTLLVGLVLSFVTMLSVLSVPMMVAGSQPTMMTVDMAFRINSYGDYATANALGVISYAIAGAVAWIYLRHNVKREIAA